MVKIYFDIGAKTGSFMYCISNIILALILAKLAVCFRPNRELASLSHVVTARLKV